MAETITPSGSAAWVPVQGSAVAGLGNYLLASRELPSRADFDEVVRSSLEIIRRCQPFDKRVGSRVGLVIGYVQSGKTISMTTVASLARDNGCRLVVLLAGTKKNLLKQTATERVRPYLQQDSLTGWRVVDSLDTKNLDTVGANIESWARHWRREDVAEDQKRPLFITVMKNRAHLQALAKQFENADLSDVPTLIIDDEADQASLDTTASRKSGGTGPSTTYRNIRNLRDRIPHHTYLQYTATPQAPLLISLADMLSPDFCVVLEPGRGYTGGRAFFQQNRGLVTSIPEDDLFEPKDPPDAPPDSLSEAMRIFVVGSCIQRIKGVSPSSMLIHPSQIKEDHASYYRFAVRLKQTWEEQLDQPRDHPSRLACVEAFRTAYQKLSRGDASLPTFEEVESQLDLALNDTYPHKVNSDDGREVDWNLGPHHILVGGDKLNRGYTVKGLIVTYMPRRPGSWTADTIQQRARFFGYKDSYLNLCRLYLHPDVELAFRDYVEHEENLRDQLSTHLGSLREWKRVFFLSHRQNPTRRNVLSASISKPKHTGWFRQSHPHIDDDLILNNREMYSRVQERIVGNLRPHADFPQHLCATVPLATLFDEFLPDYECLGPDSISWTAMRLWVADLLSDFPDAKCTLFSMDHSRTRKRSEDSGDGRIALFQGRSSSQDEGAYPGDASFRNSKDVTLQLHRLDVATASEGVKESVPAIAVHLPGGFTPKDVQLGG